MFSETDRRRNATAAWPISILTMLLFAAAITIAFSFMHHFVSAEIRMRSDAWLIGEAKVLGEVAEQAPKGGLYDRMVGEVAELATKEIPNDSVTNDSVFFMDVAADGKLKLWIGDGKGEPFLSAIRGTEMTPGEPRTISVPGFRVPFRVIGNQLPGADTIYLGLSDSGVQAVMRRLRNRFFMWWLAMVLLGFTTVFYSTRHMLVRVQRITETASRIGRDNLSTRVPVGDRGDEISRLAFTLNHMLDRIQSSVSELHTITDSLAHDLRSPITAIRGKLEVALSNTYHAGWTEPVACAVEELDRLSELLAKKLDVAEANADALRLQKRTVDLSDLLRSMVDLYEPSMSERNLQLTLRCDSDLCIDADPSLIHRMLANLFDNEMKHIPGGSLIVVSLVEHEAMARLTIQDNGLGFPPEIDGKVFERFAKGKNSKGSGIGLAFVEAVVRAHGGRISAGNSVEGGIRIAMTFALSEAKTAPVGYATQSAEMQSGVAATT